MSPGRAIVVGSDSLIGGALVRFLRRCGWEVIGTSRRPPSPARPDVVSLDLAEPIALKLPDCDVAFICAAMTRFAECRADPELARRVNSEAPAALARDLVRKGSKVVFLSTAAVLDCRAPQMVADRPRDGLSVYGRLKAEAEVAILNLGSQATVLRITKVLTEETPLLCAWIERLRDGGTIEAFEDHRVSPLAVADVAWALAALAERSAGGLYQMSGAQDVSYRDLAVDLAAALGLPSDRVVATCAADRLPQEDRTAYTSLDCRRLRELTGFRPPEPLALVRSLLGLPAR